MTNKKTKLPDDAEAIMIAATNGNEVVMNDPVYRQCISNALRELINRLEDRIYTADGYEYSSIDAVSSCDILCVAEQLIDPEYL